jgi:hypothetical protein
MYKCVISGGCGYAYGFGLNDRSKRYAQFIANHLNAVLIDRSITNAGNELIASSLVVGINEALKTYKSNEIVVLVGWTTIERYEYYNMEYGRITSSVKDEFRLVGNEANSQIRIAKFINSNLWDPSYGYYKMIHSFNYLNSVCETKKIKVVHRRNTGHNQAFNRGFPKVSVPHSEINNKDLIDKALLNEYAHQYKICMESDVFEKFAEKKGMISKNKYPTEEGHYNWAKHLIAQHGSLNINR